MAIPILRVSQLNRFVRSLLESAPQLSEVYLRGEIANFALYPSGHCYFSLRDEEASVRAVMFRANAAQLRFLPENGMRVLARGAVTLYERDGAYQLNVSELLPDGAGERALALSQLRRRLTEEGLFAEERKRPLPPHPAVIGVVTSQKGAVLHDIVSVLERKAPYLRVLLSPASVQGAQAACEMVDALKLLAQDGRSDVILLARGGGSAEDLWSFQEEAVVRAVASSPIPVISAIGHETDTTLCDWAADRRAATPTAAAEIAVGTLPDLSVRLSGYADSLHRAALCALDGKCGLFSQKKMRLSSFDPASILAYREKRMYNITETLHNLSQKTLLQKQELVRQRAKQLELVSPLRVLARGYSITTTENRLLTSASGLQIGDTITTQLADGTLSSVVTEVLGHDL